MKTLSKQEVLAGRDRMIERVEVPEWGGAVYVRSMTAKERGVFEAAAARFNQTKGKDDSFVRTFTMRMAGICLCDENGDRWLTDDEIEQLADRNAAVIARIAAVAQRLSGLAREDIEALAKNSGEAQLDDSPSV